MELFNKHYLKVIKLNILKNERGQSKGAGFVEFETVKDANYVVNKLDGFSIN